RSFCSVSRFLQHNAEIFGASFSVLCEHFLNREQSVEQGLVAALCAATGLNAFDCCLYHVRQVGNGDGFLALRWHSSAHEAGAPDRAGRAANMLGYQHGKLQQERANGGLVEVWQFFFDYAKASGQRVAEVAVASKAVEVA